MKYLFISLRTIFFYFIIILSYRIMGKREIAQLSISDLTISILIAELVALGIEDANVSIEMALIPIAILVILEVLFAYLQLRFNKIKGLLDGKPSIIIKKGKLNIKEMIKQRFSMDDLLLALRSNSIKSIDEVNYCILETNGKVSIFKKHFLLNNDDYPLPLIIDGIIDYDALLFIRKNEHWLNNKIIEYGYNLKDILYAFYKNKRIFVIKK